MEYRTLGASGIRLSRIGFGGWGIGGRTAGATSYGETDDAESRRALECAFEHGITFFDTADVYGDGRSERLIGEVFEGRRDQVTIATKAGYLPGFVGVDHSPAALRRALEGSLTRLRTDYVDLFLLHEAQVSTVADDPQILTTLEAFRHEGKARAYGLSAKSPADALAFVDLPDVACLQVNLNLLDWGSVDCGLHERAQASGVGIVARTVLGLGFLTGRIGRDTVFPPEDHRSLWSRKNIGHWVDAADEVHRALGGGDSVAERTQTAVRFCLSFDAVTSAIPGMLTPEEVAVNAVAGDLPPFSPTQLGDVERLYRRVEDRLADG